MVLPQFLGLQDSTAWLQILQDLPGLATRLPRERFSPSHVTPAHRLRYNGTMTTAFLLHGAGILGSHLAAILLITGFFFSLFKAVDS